MARGLFERFLPQKVRTLIDLETISLAESKHVSDDGITLYNDVLYRCELDEGQPGYLFAMCEHQSTPEAQMPLRLLKYNIATIEKHRKQDHGRFPVMVNIVLYHGKQPWNYSTAFADYYAYPELGKEFLDMAPFTLIDVPNLSRADIHRDGELGFCFEAFRCTSDSDPYTAFASTMLDPAFKVYFDTLPKELRKLVLAYLGNCIDREKHSLADLVNLVSSNPQEKTEIMTSIMAGIAQDMRQSIAQEYEKKGRKEGRQVGRKEGRQVGRKEGRQVGKKEGIQIRNVEIARNMLSSNEPKEKIHQFTGLSWVEIEQLIKEKEGTR